MISGLICIGIGAVLGFGIASALAVRKKEEENRR